MGVLHVNGEMGIDVVLGLAHMKKGWFYATYVESFIQYAYNTPIGIFISNLIAISHLALDV